MKDVSKTPMMQEMRKAAESQVKDTKAKADEEARHEDL